MEDFFIDKTRDTDLLKHDGEDGEVETLWSDVGTDEEVEECIQLDDYSDSEETKKKTRKKKTDQEYGLDNTYVIMENRSTKKNEKGSSYVEKLLEKSIITPGFEKQFAVITPSMSKRLLRKEQKKIEEQTKGKGWFHLPATEVTEEIKNDLEILKMRSVLDPKHVYKKNDIKVLPKYFHIGKVVEGPADFYNGRIPKAHRKRTIVDELLADSECKAYQKKKYKEIVDVNRRKKGQKAHTKAKQLKKKKK